MIFYVNLDRPFDACSSVRASAKFSKELAPIFLLVSAWSWWACFDKNLQKSLFREKLDDQSGWVFYWVLPLVNSRCDSCSLRNTQWSWLRFWNFRGFLYVGKTFNAIHTWLLVVFPLTRKMFSLKFKNTLSERNMKFLLTKCQPELILLTRRTYNLEKQ